MLYNETKKRKATPNEIAKRILIDSIESRLEFLGESFLLDDVKKFDSSGKPTKEYSEIYRHFEKHFYSIVDRLTNGDEFKDK